MEVLLDSNFIVSCLRKKIDFISDLEGQGFAVFLPKEVYQELKDLKNKVSHEDKIAVEMALTLFESKKLKRISLGNQSVDSGLIEKGRQGYYIATLDAAIKRQAKNRVLINNAQNKIVIERD
jgi:rRNA-processing protein FCF1